MRRTPRLRDPVRAVALATDIIRPVCDILRPSSQRPIALLFKSGGYVENFRAQRFEREGAPDRTGDAVAKGEVLASVRQSDYEERARRRRVKWRRLKRLSTNPRGSGSSIELLLGSMPKTVRCLSSNS